MIKFLSPLIAVLAVMFWGSGITTAPSQQITPVMDGAHQHYGYETQIAALSTEIYVERQINRDQSTLNAAMWGTLDSFSLSTEVATLVASGTPVPTHTARPSSTPSATVSPSATNTVQGQPPSPTSEVLQGTFTPTVFVIGTNTPTRTRTPVIAAPTATSAISATPTVDPAWINGCAPNGDFEPQFTINTRTEPRITAQKVDTVAATDTVIVCAGSLTAQDENGFRWMQIVSTVRVEWFAVQQDGEWWGVLTVWPE